MSARSAPDSHPDGKAQREPRFDYEEAFSRNLGWVTETEQRLLRQKRIAIAGLGGVGGGHLLTLARLGIGAFSIADLDVFELVNFNRQAGATMSALGRPKVDVLAAMARDINPELALRTFPAGVDAGNVDAFLDGADAYVDSLDFFAFDARRAVFAACARRGIPAVTAAPLGMGAALLVFVPGGMTFEEYFRFEDLPELDQSIRFMLGLAPAALYATHLVDRTRVGLAERRGPSTGIACQLCAGIAAAQVLKILLQRGEVIAAPRGLHFDPYANAMARTHPRAGNRGPLQRAKIWIAGKVLAARHAEAPRPAAPPPETAAEHVLAAARWAPSGDNTQVWRFEILGPEAFRIHAHDTRDHVVYDRDGRASQLAVGALLENVDLAASTLGRRADVRRRPAAARDRELVFDVALTPDAAVVADPLAAYIPIRSVQRRALSTRPLTPGEKASLEAAAGRRHTLVWLEGARARWTVARILFESAKIRLTMPEAFAVHRSVIAYGAQFSEDRMPDEAIGLDPLALAVMRWAMERWERVDWLNRYAGGTWLPRIELDLVPGLACAAHVAIVAARPPESVDDHLDAGRAMQRVWLEATRLGLQMQPETTPLIFAAYFREGRRFSAVPGLWERAARVSRKLGAAIGEERVARAVFLARLGHGPAAAARSLRRPLGELAREPRRGGGP
jgi:molybdopterin/thiamine biosynthesis adenylyltransferase/nitroreductase